MRTYGQYCALARSLDIVGDRWTLLIIRELFARDSRYSDLLDGLPGIATNLLADRLRHLQNFGLIEAYEAPRPIRATVYRLTPRGRELGPVLRSLVNWGMPLLDATVDGAEFRPQWQMLALRILFEDVDTAGIEPLTVVIANDDEPVTVEVTADAIDVHLGPPASSPTIEIDGDAHAIYTFLAGTDATTSETGVTLHGAAVAIERLEVLIDRVKARQPFADSV